MCYSTFLGSVKGGVGNCLRTEDGLPARDSDVCKTGISECGSVTRKVCKSSCCSLYIMTGQTDIKSGYYQTLNSTLLVLTGMSVLKIITCIGCINPVTSRLNLIVLAQS